MMKNRRNLVVAMALFVPLFVATSALANDAAVGTIAVEAPLKSAASVIGGKAIQTLSPGTAIKILQSKSTMTQVQLVDDPSVKGWVMTGAITRNKDVSAAIAKGKSVSGAGSDAKTRIGSSIGGVAKGLTADSVALGPAAKGLSQSAGAVARGKVQEATDEIDDQVDSAEAEVKSAAGSIKGKSSATLEKIESQKVSESEIAEFMKQGGLRSRIIR